MTKNMFSAILPEGRKEIKKITDEMKVLSSLQYSQSSMEQFTVVQREIASLSNDMNTLMAFGENLDKYGYDPGVVSVCNIDGSLHRMLQISPEDFIGKSPAGYADVYQANFWSGLKRIAVAIWEKIIQFLTWLASTLGSFVKFTERNKRGAVNNMFESNIKNINVKDTKLPDTAAYSVSDVIGRISAISGAFREIGRMNISDIRQINPGIVSRFLSTIQTSIVLQDMSIRADGVVTCNPLSTYPNKTFEELGWVEQVTRKIDKYCDDAEKEEGKLYGVINTMLKVAKKEKYDAERVTPSNDPNELAAQKQLVADKQVLADCLTIMINAIRTLYDALKQTYTESRAAINYTATLGTIPQKRN